MTCNVDGYFHIDRVGTRDPSRTIHEGPLRLHVGSKSWIHGIQGDGVVGDTSESELRSDGPSGRELVAWGRTLFSVGGTLGPWWVNRDVSGDPV